MKIDPRTEPYKVIIAPVLTERTTDIMTATNTYVFKVHPDADKVSIKSAIEKIFDVTVESVNVANRKGKPRRLRLQQGRRSNWKKAYVKLAEGSRIDLI
ncbi:MAG: 50S ribosomal protein L23 [Planctomycetota bacterium]|nr:50S ribosomal protein L23 [Planctomycetota bacterium]